MAHRIASRNRSRLPVPIVITVAAAVLLSACAGGSQAPSSAFAEASAGQGSAVANAESATNYWASAFAKNPKDEQAAIAYARALRGQGDKQKALSVLQQASMVNPDSRAIASEHGRLALELGQIEVAEKLLVKADASDWRVASALGTIQAKKGNSREARQHFERALELKPGEPSVINNLALAYALDGDAAKAEQLLRKAVAEGADADKVRQNLALVLGLQGKFEESQQVAAADLSSEKAKANTEYLQKMVKATPIQLAKAPATSMPPAAAPVASGTGDTSAGGNAGWTVAAAPANAIRGSAEPETAPQGWDSTVVTASR